MSFAVFSDNPRFSRDRDSAAASEVAGSTTIREGSSRGLQRSSNEETRGNGVAVSKDSKLFTGMLGDGKQSPRATANVAGNGDVPQISPRAAAASAVRRVSTLLGRTGSFIITAPIAALDTMDAAINAHAHQNDHSKMTKVTIDLENTLYSQYLNKRCCLPARSCTRCYSDHRWLAIKVPAYCLGFALSVLGLLKILDPVIFVPLAMACWSHVPILSFLFIDLQAVKHILYEFDFWIVTISLLVFMGFMVDALHDARIVLMIFAFVNVTSFLFFDVSYPFAKQQVIGVLLVLASILFTACYVILQFGIAPDMTFTTYNLTMSIEKKHSADFSFDSVQYASDRLLVAIIFMFKFGFQLIGWPEQHMLIQAPVGKSIYLEAGQDFHEDDATKKKMKFSDNPPAPLPPAPLDPNILVAPAEATMHHESRKPLDDSFFTQGEPEHHSSSQQYVRMESNRLPGLPVSPRTVNAFESSSPSDLFRDLMTVITIEHDNHRVIDNFGKYVNKQFEKKLLTSQQRDELFKKFGDARARLATNTSNNNATPNNPPISIAAQVSLTSTVTAGNNSDAEKTVYLKNCILGKVMTVQQSNKFLQIVYGKGNMGRTSRVVMYILSFICTLASLLGGPWWTSIVSFACMTPIIVTSIVMTDFWLLLHLLMSFEILMVLVIQALTCYFMMQAVSWDMRSVTFIGLFVVSVALTIADVANVFTKRNSLAVLCFFAALLCMLLYFLIQFNFVSGLVDQTYVINWFGDRPRKWSSIQFGLDCFFTSAIYMGKQAFAYFRNKEETFVLLKRSIKRENRPDPETLPKWTCCSKAVNADVVDVENGFGTTKLTFSSKDMNTIDAQPNTPGTPGSPATTQGTADTPSTLASQPSGGIPSPVGTAMHATRSTSPPSRHGQRLGIDAALTSGKTSPTSPIKLLTTRSAGIFKRRQAELLESRQVQVGVATAVTNHSLVTTTTNETGTAEEKKPLSGPVDDDE